MMSAVAAAADLPASLSAAPLMLARLVRVVRVVRSRDISGFLSFSTREGALSNQSPARVARVKRGPRLLSCVWNVVEIIADSVSGMLPLKARFAKTRS
jgi:hypothetical protein